MRIGTRLVAALVMLLAGSGVSLAAQSQNGSGASQSGHVSRLCPSGMIPTATACICPATMVLSGGHCVCPQGLHLDSSTGKCVGLKVKP